MFASSSVVLRTKFDDDDEEEECNTCDRISSCRFFVFVIPVIVLEENAGSDKSCLHRLVPNTPHPKTAKSEEDDIVEGVAAATKASDGEAFNNFGNVNDRKIVVIDVMDIVVMFWNTYD